MRNRQTDRHREREREREKERERRMTGHYSDTNKSKVQDVIIVQIACWSVFKLIQDRRCTRSV